MRQRRFHKPHTWVRQVAKRRPRKSRSRHAEYGSLPGLRVHLEYEGDVAHKGTHSTREVEISCFEVEVHPLKDKIVERVPNGSDRRDSPSHLVYPDQSILRKLQPVHLPIPVDGRGGNRPIRFDFGHERRFDGVGRILRRRNCIEPVHPSNCGCARVEGPIRRVRCNLRPYLGSRLRRHSANHCRFARLHIHFLKGIGAIYDHVELVALAIDEVASRGKGRIANRRRLRGIIDRKINELVGKGAGEPRRIPTEGCIRNFNVVLSNTTQGTFPLRGTCLRTTSKSPFPRHVILPVPNPCPAVLPAPEFFPVEQRRSRYHRTRRRRAPVDFERLRIVRLVRDCYRPRDGFCRSIAGILKRLLNRFRVDRERIRGRGYVQRRLDRHNIGLPICTRDGCTQKGLILVHSKIRRGKREGNILRRARFQAVLGRRYAQVIRHRTLVDGEFKIHASGI